MSEPLKKPTEQKIKTKTTLDEQIKVAHEVLWAVCAFMVFIVVGFLLSPKARPPQVPLPPEEERIVAHENYPKLWNYYLAGSIRNQDVNILSNWDGLTQNTRVDSESNSSSNLVEMRRINPNLISLVYIRSPEAYCLPSGWRPGFDYLVDERGWWLYDYEGNKTSGWPNNCAVNQTYLVVDKFGVECNPEIHDSYYENEDCAYEALANYIVNEHIEKYPEHWDGVFYDTFADNQRWYARCRKDADRDGTPTKDFNQTLEDCNTGSGSEDYEDLPQNQQFDNFYFDNIWNEGMVALVDYTLSPELAPGLPIVGNGLNRNTLSQTNGMMTEAFGDGSDNIHTLCNAQHYVLNTKKDPPISIINGWPRRDNQEMYPDNEYPLNEHFENPMDYQNLRWTMGATLLVDAYFSFDFGSWDHAETVWYDEYNVKPDGEVAAVTTNLASDIIDKEQQVIEVDSSAGFTDSGLILIEGE